MHNSNIFIYFSPLHVSGVHALIIRRKLLYLCDTGICQSLWVASGLLADQTPPIQSDKIQSFSPDDEHMDAQNMQRRDINILSRIVHLVGLIYKIIQGFTVNKT